MKRFLILLLISTASSLKLNCKFEQTSYWIILDPVYTCVVQSADLSDNATFATAVNGNHLAGLSNLGVKSVHFNCLNNYTLNAIPKGLSSFFPNLARLSFMTCPFDALSGDALTEYKNLEAFTVYAGNLITIPGNFFEPTPKVNFLDFSANEIENLPNEFLNSLTKMSVVDFTYNVCIDKIALDSLGVSELIEEATKNCVAITTTTIAPTTPKCNNVIETGQDISLGFEIFSCNGKFKLQLQADGNLAVWKTNEAFFVWSSGTYRRGITRAVMQSDGNFVLYKGLSPIWSTNTKGNNFKAKVEDNGRFTIYENSIEKWSSRPLGRTDTIYSGEEIPLGTELISPRGCFKMVLQDDGNLVVYYNKPNGGVLWTTNTQNKGVYKAVIQKDGRFRLWTRTAVVVWETTWANNNVVDTGARVVIQDDGNVVVYQGNLAMWASGKVGRTC